MPPVPAMPLAEVKGRAARRFTAPFHASGRMACSSMSLMECL
jgi:hypothetical protein